MTFKVTVTEENKKPFTYDAIASSSWELHDAAIDAFGVVKVSVVRCK